ncbi:hypothetical protein E05_45190 [Plautia stali symbiont]|nr:hypothetical protein E05_45190 [Plautia stali symbiont]
MNTFTRRKKAALLPLATLMLGAAPPALVEGFVEDSTLEGTVYYWQRHRERKDLDPHSAHYQHYQTNRYHKHADRRARLSVRLSGRYRGH